MLFTITLLAHGNIEMGKKKNIKAEDLAREISDYLYLYAEGEGTVEVTETIEVKALT